MTNKRSNSQGKRSLVDSIDSAEKKRLRIIRNRASAQESRDRQKRYIKSLEDKNKELLELNSKMEIRLKTIEDLNASLMKRIQQVQNSPINSSNAIVSDSFVDVAGLFSSSPADTGGETLTPSFESVESELFKLRDPRHESQISIEEFIDWPAENSFEELKMSSFDSYKENTKALMHSSEAASTSQKWMALVNSLKFPALPKIAPMMLFAYCSLLSTSCENQMWNILNEVKWNGMLAEKYPNCYEILKESCK
jgi:hypothetical protein